MMTKKDIIRKFTSRKFWASLIAFVSSILTACHVAEGEIAQVAAILTAGGSLIAYILAEGWIDANREIGGSEHGNDG